MYVRLRGLNLSVRWRSRHSAACFSLKHEPAVASYEATAGFAFYSTSEHIASVSPSGPGFVTLSTNPSAEGTDDV